jgi:hypothetical protein
MMDLLTITFDQTYREMSRMKFVARLSDIGDQITLMGKMAKIAGVYRAARAKERRHGIEMQRFQLPNIRELRRRGNAIEDCPSFNALCEEMTAWLGEKFPLLEDITYSLWTDNNENNALIQIDNPGIDLCWDEATEMFECPENFNKDYGLMLLPIYAVFFSQFIGEDQEKPAFWGQAARWFGWDEELPWWLWLPDSDWATDNQKFYRLLKKASLPKVADTFRMAWHDTGTFFLDLEHQHEACFGYDDTVHELSVEKIKELAALWDEARPIHDRGFEACFEAFEHPEVYKTIVALLGRCIVPPKNQKITLMELKAAAAEIKQRAVEHSEGNEEDRNDPE